MKLSKEVTNGAIIFLGIGIYFLLINLLGFADSSLLRVFNVLFLFYGVNRTIKTNLAEGKKDFVKNAIAGIITAFIGVFFSVIGLIIYSHIMGGDAYVESLSKTFLFGGNPSISTYSICLLFEGIASAVVVTMLLMLYWNDRHKAD
jgi:hypothetical protein